MRHGMDPDISRSVKASLIRPDFKAICKIGKKKLYTVRISGTTFSGHPTRTTLCNSLRTLTYVCYLFYKATGDLSEMYKVFYGTSDVCVVYVAGDDVMITGRRDITDMMKEQLSIYYAPSTEVGTFGLG